MVLDWLGLYHLHLTKDLGLTPWLCSLDVLGLGWDAGRGSLGSP